MNFDNDEKKMDRQVLRAVTLFRQFYDCMTCPNCNFYKKMEEQGLTLITHKKSMERHTIEGCFRDYLGRSALFEPKWRNKGLQEIEDFTTRIFKKLEAFDAKFRENQT